MTTHEYPVTAYIDPVTHDPELWFAADMSGVRHYHEDEQAAINLARAANAVIAKHARLNPTEREFTAIDPRQLIDDEEFQRDQMLGAAETAHDLEQEYRQAADREDDNEHDQ